MSMRVRFTIEARAAISPGKRFGQRTASSPTSQPSFLLLTPRSASRPRQYLPEIGMVDKADAVPRSSNLSQRARI